MVTRFMKKRKYHKKHPNDFWDNSKVISEFYNLQPQDYWRKLFVGMKDEQLKILDLGCGGGRYTQMLAEMGFQVYACDKYDGMVDATKKRIGQFKNVIEVQKKDMASLGYENDFFDIVLANGVYHNAVSKAKFTEALEETYRILKKGGMLCLNVFYQGENTTKLKKINTNLYETVDDLIMVLYSKESLGKMLKKFGLINKGIIHTYVRDMAVGKRDVYRGVFIKK